MIFVTQYTKVMMKKVDRSRDVAIMASPLRYHLHDVIKISQSYSRRVIHETRSSRGGTGATIQNAPVPQRVKHVS